MMRSNMIFLAAVVLAVVVLSAPALAILTGQINPRFCDNGKKQWSNCDNAKEQDGFTAYASVSGNQKKTAIWNKYLMDIPENSAVNKVEVTALFYANNKDIGRLEVRVSKNGKNGEYGPPHTVGDAPIPKNNLYLIDVTPDFPVWTPLELNNGEFTVQATCFQKPPNQNKKVLCELNWIPAQANYLPNDPNYEKCIRATPTVTITPKSQNGLLGGEYKDYYTTVINKDSPECGPSYFKMEYKLPDGYLWDGQFNPVLMKINPGDKKTTKFFLKFVKTDKLTYKGTYTFKNFANNVGVPEVPKGEDQAEFVVI